MLVAGGNRIVPVPADRWLARGNTLNGAGEFPHWGGFLDGIDTFDHRFFGISPREARSMDPQQRLLLEQVWRCIEDSGIPLVELQGKVTAVFVGGMTVEYEHELRTSGLDVDAYDCSGTFRCMLANRISHAFDFKGPSLSIDTACSSSLVALHQAREALDAGRCDFALVAAASLNLNPWKYESFSKARMLSPDGQCKTFDQQANGYVPGEGVAALLLQRSDNAHRDRQPVHGLLKGSASNHGGHAISLTAPRVEAQRDVIVAAWQSAGLAPKDCSYIEAHGTGTSLGDPIEVEALTQAFRQTTTATQFCHIGSVKTNIGHLEPAAGIAGVIKVLLMMKARHIPATLNVRVLNPLIDFGRTPFRVAATATPWSVPTRQPLRAGVSSFGFGGANAHVVLESAPAPTRRRGAAARRNNAPELMVFSAKSPESLQRLLATWTAFARTAEFAALDRHDVARTLQSGRESFPHRFATLARQPADFVAALEAGAGEATATPGPLPRICLLVGAAPPKGIVPAGRNQRLDAPAFSEAWRTCVLAARRLGHRLELTTARPAAVLRRLREFAVQYASSRQLMAVISPPASIAGEGIGFWVALALSEMLSLEQAMELLVRPSAVRTLRLARPRMTVLNGALGPEIRPFVITRDYLETLRSDLVRLEAEFPSLRKHALQLLDSQFTFKKNLEAWNESLTSLGRTVEALLNEPAHNDAWRPLTALIIADSLRKLNRKWRLVSTLAVSSVQTCELLDLLDDGVLETREVLALVFDPASSLEAIVTAANERWANLDPLKPYTALRRFNDTPTELGDPKAWLRLASQASLPKRGPVPVLRWLVGRGPARTDKAHQIDADFEIGDVLNRADLLPALQLAWQRGVALQWNALPGAGPYQRVSLPTCEFVGEPLWVGDKPTAQSGASLRQTAEPVRIERRFDRTSHPVVNDHTIGGRPLLPAACLLDLALALALKSSPETGIAAHVRDFAIRRPTIMDRPRLVKAQVAEDRRAFALTSEGETLATGSVARTPANLEPGDLSMWQSGRLHDGKSVYPSLAASGYAYGPALQVITRYWESPAGLLFELSSTGPSEALVDGTLQVALVAAWHFKVVPPGLWLPSRIDSVQLLAAPSGTCYMLAPRAGCVREKTAFHTAVQVFSAAGQPLLALDGAHFTATAGAVPAVPAVAHTTARPASVSAPAPTASGPAAPDGQSSANSPGSLDLAKLEAELIAMLGRTLRVTGQDLEADADLRDYGLDSLTLTEYAEVVEARFAVQLDPTQLYSHPTLRGLAGYLAKAFPTEIGHHFPARPGVAIPTALTETRRIPTEPSASPSAVTDRSRHTGAIAIVGVAGRFPQSADLDAFWRNLAAGADLVTEVPKDRWSWEDCFGDPHRGPNKTNSKWGGFMPAVDTFDASFFRISPKEAALMDPQQRIMLELAWQAIEDSGHAPSALRGSPTGVFIGVCNDDYRELIDRHAHQVEAQTSTGTYFSIIPNRLSYWFDWHGPSLAIDTACSSSLVALHQAVQAIHNGDCRQALAGGINVCCTPRRHISFSHAGMLSPEGRCRSFDAAGRGYVRGEGAGLVLLKPLEQALADGNPIYGLIRGSAVNHGGSANSLTAPNPNAQADLLVQAYASHGIAPDSVGYIEAHGTGTELGDPIEIAGLKQAFEELARRAGSPAPGRPWCGIGAVKTNIGHLESAAGIAGVVKVLLALRHRFLPGTVHFNELNPHIDLAGSPFFVVAQPQPWQPLTDTHGRPLPRRAGVSSFGFGGVNAHVILEEWSGEDALASAPSSDRPHEIVVLSARSEPALQRSARALLAWLNTQPLDTLRLADLAYTLQTGRDAMDCRAAFAVTSKAELVGELTRLVEAGRTPAAAKRSADLAAGPGALRDEPEDRAFVLGLWAAGKAARIARLWAAGSPIPWDALAPQPRPRRISLPTYAFEPERHWIADAGPVAQRGASLAARRSPDPAITSAAPNGTAEPGDFSRSIAWDDGVVRDHVVMGHRILPGVVGLEWARAAAAEDGLSGAHTLADVLWMRPVVVEAGGLDVRIRLQPDGAGRRYELVSGSRAGETVHATGRVSSHSAKPPADLDLTAIRGRCPEIESGDAVYRTFKACGADYGPFFTGLRHVCFSSTEFLGRIEFPADSISATDALPPPVMDSAVQITLWWLLKTRGPDSDLYLPFSLERLDVLGTPVACGFVHVRALEINRAAGIGRFDLALSDASGRIWAQLSGFCIRRFKSRPAAETRNPSDAAGAADGIFFRPVWRTVDRPFEAAVPSRATGRRVIFRHTHDGAIGETLAAHDAATPTVSVYLGRSYDRTGQNTFSIDVRRQADFERVLTEIGTWDEVCFLGGVDRRTIPEVRDPRFDQQQEQSVFGLFRLIKALAATPAAAVRQQILVATSHAARVTEGDTRLDPFAAATGALAQVAAREFPHWHITVADLRLPENGEQPATPALDLSRLDRGESGRLTAWRRGQPWQRMLQSVQLEADSGPTAHVRTGGTYLIVGGARGLGLETARLLAREARANLILVGRRPLDAAIESVLRDLSELGAQAEYHAGDVSVSAEIAAIVAAAGRRFGSIHGVVYSALVLRDAPLARMDEADFRAALAPKARGLAALQAALAREPLDFLLVYSSVNAFWSNAGQGNYVAGCAFHDACTLQSRPGTPPVRVINWGFWGETGVVSGGAYHDVLARHGVYPFSNVEGIAALRRILAGPLEQVVAARLGPAVLRDLQHETTRVCQVTPAVFPSCFEHVGEALRTAPVAAPAASLTALFDRLADYGRLRLLQFFLSAEPRWQPGEALEKAALRQRLKADACRPRHFDALLDLLAAGGFVELTGDLCRLTPRSAEPALLHRLEQLPSERDETNRRFPDAEPYHRLMDACLDRLGPLCRGDVSPLEVLFPDGASTLVDAIYRDNAASDYFNQLVAAAVCRFVETRRLQDPAARVRIVEIGAGVGGTTAAVLSALSRLGGDLTYHFTDLSPALVQAARQRWSDAHPWVQFHVLDIERDPAGQLPNAGPCDLVLATNVLHATRDLGEALRHVKSLLGARGLLLVNEVTQSQPYLTLTFGWLEGWWRRADDIARIPHSPLLLPSQWRQLLRTAGFTAVAAWGDPGSTDSDRSCQTLLLAESDGAVEILVQPTVPAPATVPTPAPAAPRPAGVAAPAPAAEEPPVEIEARLAVIVGDAVGRAPDAIAPDARFTDLGVDSIVGIAIVNRINGDLGLRLKPTAIFNYTSLADLAAHVQTLRPVVARPAPAPAPAPSVPPVAPTPAAAVAASNGAAATPPATVRPLVAIVGMSARFPGAADVNEFWENLAAGKDGTTEVPVSRWGRHDSFYHPDRATAGRSYLKSGGFVDGIEYFDPLFFDLSPREAQKMDPQQRLFLEESWRAIEDAGYSSQQLADARCGVFVGVSKGDYFEKMHAAGMPLDSHTWIGNETSILSARIAYHLNLKGPAFPVDTACSSSLVALHLACQSILAGDCDLGLVGGVFLLTTPTFYIHTSKTMMLSPAGKCRAFDDAADGFVPGEGAAAIVLKSLDRALADGDHIYGVIRGSGVNQDGRTNGITAPNALSQQRLVQDVYERAGVDPATITCVEAHGTGTKLGDPIEVEALTAAFRARTAATQFCALGSVKTNIGHTATVAGLAGLIKLLLSFRHGRIPPSLHFTTPNAAIDFAASPFFVNTALRPWRPVAGAPRRGAVSSFGFSGTNSHVIVEEPPPPSLRPPAPPRPSQLFCLSAKTETALRERVRLLCVWLESVVTAKAGGSIPPEAGDVAYTLNAGRTHFGRRLACVATSLPDLLRQLLDWMRTGSAESVVASAGLVRETAALRDAVEKQLGSWLDPERGAHSRLLSLARLYAEGARFDWERFFRGERRRRIPLPTYPFERERCWPWPEQVEGEVDRESTVAAVTAPTTRPRKLLTKTWRPQPLDDLPVASAPGTWLLVSDGPVPDDWRAALATRPDQRWVLVRDASRATRVSEHERAFPFADATLAEAASRELISAFPDIRGLVHVACATTAATVIEQPPFGVFTLYQKLLEHFRPGNFTLLLVTEGLHGFRNATPSLAGAIPAGLVRVLGTEYGQLCARTVDLDTPFFSASGLAIVQRELACRGPMGEVCYRQGERHGSALTEIDPGAANGPALRVDPSKVYLVTGGLGGLGFEVARLLVQKGARKLVLLGRTSLPPRAEWNALAAGAEPTPVRERIRRIRDLETATGVTPWVANPTLDDEAALAEFLSTVRHKLGLFGGVVHCAGTVGRVGTPFLHRTAADMAAVMAPKIAGTQHLSRVLRHDPLDFFILFSSVAGLVPELGVGAADYACANAFLDAFAAWQHGQGQTCFRALNWPSWRDAGIGEVKSARFLETGLLALGTDEGLELLERAWSVPGVSQVLPCVVDEARFRPEKLLWNRPGAATTHSVPSTSPAISATAATHAIRDRLVRVLSEQLQVPVDRLDGDASFGEFGIDSVLLAELVRKFEVVLGQPLDPSLFLEFPTLNQLSAHLHDRYGATLTARFETAPNSKPVSNAQPTVALAAPRPEVTVSSEVTPTRPAAASHEPIAIIGLAGRFPGAEDVAQLWHLLRSGQSSVREVPASRWDPAHWYRPVHAKGKTTGKWGGFLDGIDRFDAAYFGISDEDALQMDPLARLFLETGLQTVRDAGYAKEDLWNSRTGVFTGSRISSYATKLPEFTRGTIVGVGQNFIAAQVAQFLHFRGPNLVIDTACSSSLAALHFACQSLRAGDCTMALAGGVDLLLDENIFLMLSEAGVLSPDGRCRTFDAEANGYVPGEGCGAVLLKPLARALADGDSIRAVILGSAVNNDGHTMGNTTPSLVAQEELIAEALRNAGVSADTLSYIEAHGTGTMIGDPIELKGLTRAFAPYSSDRQFCGIGSVKTNLGHLHSAAGIASAAKVVLALQNRELPPTLNCVRPNPRFAFDESPFYPVTERQPWEPRQGIRRAGISSFGFGGANCHLILEEAPTPSGAGTTRPPLPPVRFQRKSYWPAPLATAADDDTTSDTEALPTPLLVLEEVAVT